MSLCSVDGRKGKTLRAAGERRNEGRRGTDEDGQDRNDDGDDDEHWRFSDWRTFVQSWAAAIDNCKLLKLFFFPGLFSFSLSSAVTKIDLRFAQSVSDGIGEQTKPASQPVSQPTGQPRPGLPILSMFR